MDFFFTLATPSVTPTGPTLGVGVPKALPQVLSPLIEGSLPTAVVAGGFDRTITATGTQTEQSYYWGRFSSLPLAAQTIAANTWTISGFNGDQDGNSNTAHWPVLYVWRPSTGAMVGAVFPGALGGSEWFANQGTQSFSLPGGQAVTCQDGDILVYEYWAYGTQGMTTGAYVQRVRFNDAVAWIRTPQTLTFYSGPAGPVGTLNVTEEADTLAAAGTVVNPPAIAGNLAVTEESDTLAATGGAPQITGTLSVTEGSDTLASTGTVVAPPARTGTLAVTEASDSLSGTGTVAWTPRTGTLAVTEGSDTLAGTGTVAWAAIAGTLAVTEGSDTVAGTGTVVAPPARTGSLAVTEGSDTLSATGTVAAMAGITGNLSVTEESDTVAATGTVVDSAGTTGTLAVTEASDTLAGSGTVAWAAIAGTLAVTEESDTAAGTGTVAWPAIAGTLAVTEGSDAVAASGTVVAAGGITGNLALTEGSDTVAAAGTVVAPAARTGTLAVTEGGDTVSAAGTVVAPAARTGTLAVTEGSDAIAATGKAGVGASLAVTEGADTLAATGTVVYAAITGNLAVTESSDTLSATGTGPVVASPGRVVELGTVTSPGTFLLNTTVGNNALFTVKGTVAPADVDFGLVTTPHVLTGMTDLSGPIIIGRSNGIQSDTDVGALGGNFGNYPLHIGGGGPLRLYQLIIRGAASSAAEVTDTERLVAAKTGVALPPAGIGWARSTVSAAQWLMVIFMAVLLTVFLAGCAVVIGSCALDTVQGRGACESGGWMILIDPDVFSPPEIVIQKGGGI